MLWEKFLRHHRPGRAARGPHKRQLLRHLFYKVLRLLGGTQVSSNGHFKNIGEAQLLHGSPELARGDLRAKLPHKSRRHRRIHPFPRLDGPDHLEDLRLVRNGTEGAVHQAHPAGDAFVVVDFRLAVFIAVDSVHPTGSGTGPLLANNGVIGTHIGAPTALDTLFRVDMRPAVITVQMDRVFGTHLYTRVGQTSLAPFGHQDSLFRTAVASKLNNIDQRRRVVSFRLVRRLNVVRQRSMLRRTAAGQPHSQPQPFAYDGPFQKYVISIIPHFTGDDFIRQRFDTFIHRPLSMIGHTGYLPEDPVPDFLNTGFYASHKQSPCQARNLLAGIPRLSEP